jgi:hypothetical protein
MVSSAFGVTSRIGSTCTMPADPLGRTGYQRDRACDVTHGALLRSTMR